jgi:hypothetical protein
MLQGAALVVLIGLTLHSTVAKTRVQVVDHLVEKGGRHQIAPLVDEIHLNRPLSLREALNLRGLITVIAIQPSARALSLSRVYPSCCARFKVKGKRRASEGQAKGKRRALRRLRASAFHNSVPSV